MGYRRMSLNQLAFVGVVVMVLFGAFLLVRNGTGQSEVQLPILAIMGVVGLLAVLTFMSQVFSNLGLSDPREALGLPSGSIRAVIALSLIVIFVISAIFLFAVLSNPISTTLPGLLASQVDGIPASQLISKIPVAGSPDRFDVLINNPAGPAAVDFAKQLLTILGTLITAITSFYFGSQAAQGPRPKPATPSLTSIDPVSVRGVAVGGREIAQDVSVQGGNLLEVTQLLLVQNTKTISGTSVTSSMSTANATFELSDQDQGDFDLVVKTRDGDTAILPKAFKVEAPPAISG